MHQPDGSVTTQNPQISSPASVDRLSAEVEDTMYFHLLGRLNDISDPRELCDNTYEMIELLLRHPEDQPLLRSLSELVGEAIGGIPFDGTPSQVRGGVRMAAQQCRMLLESAKKNRHSCPAPSSTEQSAGGAPDEPAAAEAEPEVRDVEYWLPPHLEHLLHRVEYVAPTPPPPTGGFGSFDELCQAAIVERVGLTLTFFQRHNPSIRAELPPIYLLSPEFGAKLQAAIVKYLYPQIRESRQVRVLASEIDLSKTDTAVFWQHVSKPLKAKLLTMWNSAWDQMKLIDLKRDDGSVVAQVRQDLKDLRASLEPSGPQAYDLPRIRNHEIDVLKSLLDPEIDWWTRLSAEWERCQDLYEQEKDPRVFQQQAREGAFRDSLLAAFQRFPSQWADFMALSCHRVFPRINTAFLESFSLNFGHDVKQRSAQLPYLMRYLEKVRQHPEIEVREKIEEVKWKQQCDDLRHYLKTNRAAND